MRKINLKVLVAYLGIFMVLFLPVSVSIGAVSDPQTFLLNPELLKSNKAKIKNGDAQITAALKGLTKLADEALKKGPYTVIAKSKTPPSGDKHDYMSVGPYWWPDPQKPNGLPYIRKDGEVNPERHSIKDSDYFKDLSSEVAILGLAYYYTQQEKYAAHAAKLLRTWFLNKETKMNPNLNYGQSIPGITDGRGIGLIDTRGFVNLIDGVQLLKGSTSWKTQDQANLQEWFREFLNWMLNSPIGKDEADEHNNHGVYYDLQATSIALFIGDKALAKKILEENSLSRIESQIKEDGSQPHELARTKSWSYSLMNLTGFLLRLC